MEKVSTSDGLDPSTAKGSAEPTLVVSTSQSAPKTDEAGQVEAIPALTMTALVDAAIAEVVPLFPGTVDENSVPVEFVGEPEAPEEATPPTKGESAAQAYQGSFQVPGT